jgi:hypothetical protein
MTFRVPHDVYSTGFLQQSHGCLHYSSFQRSANHAKVRLMVYANEDYDNKEWMLKHSVETSHISGGTILNSYLWMAIHTECDLIFFTTGRGRDTNFMCYSMNSRQVKEISTLEYGDRPYLPYVPFYAELQSLHT